MSDPSADLEAMGFADLPGWADTDPSPVVAILAERGAAPAEPPPTGALGVDGAALRAIAVDAARLPSPGDAAAARAFFEARFVPHRVVPREGHPFLTGYWEPELPGSRTPTARFRHPLFARPDDLVEVDPEAPPQGVPKGYAFARRTAEGFAPYLDRAAIEDGALAGRGLERVFLEDPVDAYFVHVQGSVRIRLDDGGVMRLAYAGKAGHPYTSIGRLAIERGLISADAMSAEVLADRLRADPRAGRALMRENRSFVFFREQTDLDPARGAVAAAGLPLTPGVSLAVDRILHTFGTPIFLAADLPTGEDGAVEPFRRLMSADDTGSAIVGPARGDVFVGLGGDAARIAGRFRHAADLFAVLVPKPAGGEGGA
jgi:membrane-bound lytic murein transglycosylase A